MFQYGMTQWIVGNEPLETSLNRLKACGYDSVEFAGEPDTLDAQECAGLLRQYGLRADSMCGIYTSQRDLTAEGALGRQAIDYIHKCVDFGHTIGTRVLIVVPSPVGRLTPPADIPMERLWENAVNNIRAAADYAQQKNMYLAIEAINRYETFFANTMEKAYKMARDINHPHVGVMADTFHMNLEEADMERSLRMVADKLLHVHLADNTREPPGMGSTDFHSVLRTLKDIDYTRLLCMEFMPQVSDPYASIHEGSQSALMDRYARSAIEFMKKVEREVTR